MVSLKSWDGFSLSLLALSLFYCPISGYTGSDIVSVSYLGAQSLLLDLFLYSFTSSLNLEVLEGQDIPAW